MAEKGFTSDGFIMDQAQFTDYPYGKFTSDWNGCGWIAVFNLMHARGMGVTPEQICRLMSPMLPVGGFIGTPVKNMVKVLELFNISTEVVKGGPAVQEAALRAELGILRFFDGKYDHYVAFQRSGVRMFRFFNSDPARQMDVTTMEDFLRRRVRFPGVKLIAVK